jgi:hypothetical protein
MRAGLLADLLRVPSMIGRLKVEVLHPAVLRKARSLHCAAELVAGAPGGGAGGPGAGE